MDEAIRRALQSAASIVGTGALRHEGGSFQDFYARVASLETHAADVAARAIEYFCLDEEHRFNRFQTGLLLVATFLSLVARPALSEVQQQQALRDLRDLLQQQPSFEQLATWARSHYG